MTQDLAVLVPSRGRPHNIARLIESMNETCRGDTTLVVGVDDCDPSLPEYEVLLEGPSSHSLQGLPTHRPVGHPSGAQLTAELVVKSGLRRQLVQWLNVLATNRTRDYRFLGHIGDDNVPRTVGWDVRVSKSLERNNFCFADDLDPGREPGSLSLTIFMRSEVVKTLGYMGPPVIQHMYVDPVWFAWGQATTIEFLSDVVIEHMHYSVNGKAPMDESYQLSTSLIPDDCARYNDYCETELNADIAKLGGDEYSPEAIAEFNRRLNIPHRWGQAA